MGGARVAAVAAVSHARVFNRTHEDVTPYEPMQFNVNVFFASATLCGVVLAVCLACWRRALDAKPEERCRVYTVSAEIQAAIVNEAMSADAGPPPAYDAVVKPSEAPKEDNLEAVVTEPCPRCHAPPPRTDSGLPSYESAVLLRDSSL